MSETIIIIFFISLLMQVQHAYLFNLCTENSEIGYDKY